MSRTNGASVADGLDPITQEPSTRRVPSGSSAGALRAPDEPAFPQDSADDVFSALKETISRLWDEGPRPVEIQKALKAHVRSHD